MFHALYLALLVLPASSAPAPSRALSNSLPFRLTDGITRNLTHMSPLLNYDGDVSYVFTPPGTPDGTAPEDISGSHHVLPKGASVSFNFSGSAFVINGWSADGATVKVREEPLDAGREPGWGEWMRDVEDGREAWWTISADEVKEVHASNAVSERTLVAVFGDGDDGARRVRLDVTHGEVWVTRVIAKTDIPPSDEWGAPHWPIMGRWRGVREYLGAEVHGEWRETYVDFSNIGLEQPVAWAIGSDSDDDSYARVALSPAPGASYLELRGATPLSRFGSGRYRVRLDPPVLGHSDEWHSVEPVGDTPAVIVLFSMPLDPTIAYVVTLEARNVGWHWANAWFLAEMGVQPLPPWVGRWGRVRRVLDGVRARMGIILAVVVASAAVVLGFVVARRRVAKVREEDGERQPLLVDADVHSD